MAEGINMSEVAAEIKRASEDEIRAIIEKHFEEVRTQGIKIGAGYMSAVIRGTVNKHLNKKAKASFRDYERCIKDINSIIDVQLTEQNDLKTDNVAEGDAV